MANRIFSSFIFILFAACVLSQSFLEKKVGGIDILKCIQDGSNLKTELTRFIDELKTKGFSIDEIMHEITVLKPLIETALVDCGISMNVDFIFEELKNDKREVSIDPTKCISDIGLLVQSGTKLVQDYNTMNVFALISDIKDLVQNGRSTLRDCLNVNATQRGRRVLAVEENGVIGIKGILDCFNDVKSVIVPDLEDLVAIIKTKDIPKIIEKLSAILNDLQKTLADCGLGVQIVDVSKLLSTVTFNPIDCLTDITGLVNLVQTIISNFNAKNYPALLSNLLELVNSIKKSIADCRGSNSTVTFLDSSKIKADVFKCITDVNYEIDEIKGLISSVRAGFNFTDLLNRIQRIAAGFNDLELDCGLKSKLTNNLKSAKLNPQACLQDILNLIGSIEKIIQDYKAGSIQNLIADVEDVIQKATGISTDCLSSGLADILVQ